MQFAILGPVEARRPDGTPIALGGPQLRGLLALLALDAGRVVSAEQLIDGLHGEHPPEGAAEALQSQVSRLRRRLRDGGAPDGLVEFTPAGYRLAVDPRDVDVHRFEHLTAQAREAPGPAAKLELFTEALALWRGPALDGLADPPRAARLAELRLAATEDRVETGLALGHHDRLVAELRELTREHPLRERLIAQLIRALHGSGRSAEALAVFAEIRERLADELGADPSPELAAAHTAVLRAAPAPARRVPVPLTGFVGRAELDRLTAALRDARLVTLTGPGGAGKTRLAVEAAARAAGEACFVELATTTEVPRTVLAALGLREQGVLTPGAGADPADRLAAGLADRPLLLVLDNCEHVVAEAARLVRRLLGECAGLRVLATSREALGLTGETLVPVGALPAGAAARLFTERAAAVAPGEPPAPATVTRICAALDGLPLGIELAAARLRSLSADDVAARLGDRFGLLSRGDRTAEPRHRTLRGVVEWSWDLLDPEERLLAGRFAVFAGGARPAAVERVCDVPDADAVLTGLVEKSFVEFDGGRYRMLETIRAFCAEQGDDRRAEHAKYFLDLASANEPKLRGAHQLTALAELTAEHADLQAALRWSVTEEPETAVRLIAALSWYWWLRGLRSEATPIADTVLAAVGPEPPPGLAEEYVLCVIQASGTDVAIEPILRRLDGPLRYPYLFLLWAFSPRTKAEDGERLAALIGPDAWSLAFARIGDGLGAQYRGRIAEAEAHFSASLAAFRTLGDRWGEASALEKLAEFADWHGDHARFRELMDESVRLAGELGAAEDAADLLCRRADGVLRHGDAEAAKADYEAAAEQARAAGTPVMLARARGGLGEIARRAGDLAAARRWYSSALGLATDPVTGGETRIRLHTGFGWTAAAEGHLEEATELHQEALATALEHANLPGAAQAIEGLAGVLAGRGQDERAAFLLGVAVGLRGSPVTGDADVAGVADRVRARIGASAYAEAFDRGREMPPEQAVEEAGQRRFALGS
ncbi:AfsR/SARP family transcriptional regulator [Amycolatopsis balhimycina DSM 5908]|uniref:AfsR/SARP family transcriptional regulator n=1 Tax=Amycolatopsis balhimycina DSM 5908 TaxID=1081091 RepID=A0A428WNL6_AMYBA|nr:BTAD domain-containing putative transcriptional regulator [Amycolatopsis balhimycina]RSM44659.1 AfsR/SARP family transcriptional regulator [Amycolatopsis balhimycina DSM 5908]